MVKNMLIKDINQQKREKKVRRTLRLTPKEDINLVKTILNFEEEGIRASKNEIIRVALNEFLEQDYNTKKNQLYQHRILEKPIKRDGNLMNKDEFLLENINRTLQLYEHSNHELTEKQAELVASLKKERKRLLKSIFKEEDILYDVKEENDLIDDL